MKLRTLAPGLVLLGTLAVAGYALQSGALYGFALQVDGMVARMTAELGLEAGEVTVIATGGLAPGVVDECASVGVHEPWLTLLGLEIAFSRNS